MGWGAQCLEQGWPQGCTPRVVLQQGWGLPNKGLASPAMQERAHVLVFLIHSRILPTPRPSPPHGLLPCPRPLPLSWWAHGHGARPARSCHHRHSAAGRDLPGCPRADRVSPLPASYHHQDLLRDWAHELPSWLLLLLCGVGAASRAGASFWVPQCWWPWLSCWPWWGPWHRGGTGAAGGFLG